MAATLVAVALGAFPRTAQAGTITVTDNLTYANMGATTCTLLQAIAAANVANGVGTDTIGSATTNTPPGTNKLGNCTDATVGPNAIVFAPALAGATLTFREADFEPAPANDPYTGWNVSFQANRGDNFWYGTNALPPIASNISIDGGAAGVTLQIVEDPFDTNFGTRLRFFYVSGGLAGQLPAGRLSLRRMTLSGGIARGGYGGAGGAGMGGAIFNQGTLILDAVTLDSNYAIGGRGTFDSPVSGGGGMGDAHNVQNGGDMGGGWFFLRAFFLGGDYGGHGGASSVSFGGGGGGFITGSHGGDGTTIAGVGGGLGGLGGCSVGITACFGDGGGGGWGGTQGAVEHGMKGGAFGYAGSAVTAFGNGGGGGGVGGGGGGGIFMGGAGGFGGGGGGGFGNGNAGNGGFGGGGGYIGSSGTIGGRGGFGGGDGTGNPNTSIPCSPGSGAGMGGAIFNHRGTLELTNVTMTANSAAGGGLLNLGSGLGAAIFNLNGTVNIAFSTLVNNNVTNTKGGDLNGGPGDATVYSVAYGNKIEDGTASAASVTITNSIITGTVASNGAGNNDVVNNVVAGTHPNNTGNVATVTFMGSNLIGATLNAPSSMGATATQNGAPTSNADPMLGALANNGGATQTLLPPLGSPAVDAVDCAGAPATDQVGTARPQGSMCDLGAVEVPQFLPVFTTSSKSVLDVNGGGTLAGNVLKYTVVVANSGNDSSLATVVLDALPMQVSYVPESLLIITGAGTGAQTDAPGDDQCDFDGPTATVTCRLGTGADGMQGGSLAAGESTSFSFLVTVNMGAVGTVSNQAVISAAGMLGAPSSDTPTDGDTMTAGAQPATVVVDQCDSDALCAEPTPHCSTSSPRQCEVCPAGQCAPDAGTADAGSVASNDGGVDVDGGAITADGGATADGGTTVVDGGTTMADSGTTVVDGGIAEDGGTTMADGGTHADGSVPDGAVAMVDAGSSDAGSADAGARDAAGTSPDGAVATADAGGAEPTADGGGGEGSGPGCGCNAGTSEDTAAGPLGLGLGLLLALRRQRRRGPHAAWE